MDRRTALTLLVASLATPLAACGKKRTPEQEIEASLDKVREGLAEGRSSPLIDAIDDEYRDANELTKGEVAAMAKRYLLQYGNTEVRFQLDAVQPDESGETASAGVIASAKSESGPSRMLRFDLQLRRHDGDWKITRAAWREISLGEAAGF